MSEIERRVRVTTSRAREHIQEVRFRKSASLAVGHRNQQHPAFVWCATEDGHHGWCPEEYIEMVGKADAVALRDYDSAHLTVVEGEILEVVEQVGDYLLCRNAGGVEGWVPESSGEASSEES